MTEETYRDRMDGSMEGLSLTLKSLGWKGEGLPDNEIVDVAGAKLRVLFDMLHAAGLSKGILRAVMGE